VTAPPGMELRSIVLVVLLGLAALVVGLSAVGVLAARDTLPRMHFISPVTSVAAPLTAAAYVVDQGFGLAGALAFAIAVLLAVTGPPLGAAIARLSAEQQGLVSSERPQ
jgi:multisubunit Na+/H+ antiporter MnhG subunit